MDGAVKVRRTSRSVYALLGDSLDLLRYQRARWARSPRGSTSANDPALYAHCWRALADDCDAALMILMALRDTARDEAARLEDMERGP